MCKHFKAIQNQKPLVLGEYLTIMQQCLVLLAITFRSPSVFLSPSLYVIGATVELLWWFRREQFEKIGQEKAQNNTYKSAKVSALQLMTVSVYRLYCCRSLWAQKVLGLSFVVQQEKPNDDENLCVTHPEKQIV